MTYRILMLLENNPFPQDGRVRQEAAALVDDGYHVSVIAPRGTEQPWFEQANGVEIYRFPTPPEASGFLGYLLEYGYATASIGALSLWVLLTRGFDIVHTHNPPDTLVLIAGFFKLLGKRFVFDHHDLAPEMYSALFDDSNPIVYRALLLFEKLSCRLADAVFATNDSFRRVVIDRHGVPDEAITIVRNGPDLMRLRPVEPAADVQCAGKLTICYVGEMGFHDGVDYLLRSLHYLITDLRRTDAYCVLVGGGDAWLSMQELSTTLEIADHVLFTGWVAHTDVARYLCAADICVAPEPSNAYNDRCTVIKMMEYMALGKPIVAFDLPEHRFTAQTAAVYAQPNDELDFALQLSALMDDPVQRTLMGEAGRERVGSELAWSHQAQRLLTAYDMLTGQAVQRSLRSRQTEGPFHD